MTAAVMDRLRVSAREKAPRTCGDDALLSGRGPSQMGWYALLLDAVRGKSVLDVGCGSGEGLRLLATQASSALGIDLDARLTRPDVHVEMRSIADMPDKSFDVVVSFDVVEHVEQDREFIAHLFRVARETVFVSTPNYAVSFNRNPYHVREYMPREFERLFEGRGAVTLFAGSAKGRERVLLRRRGAYAFISALYGWKPTVPVAKVLKRMLGIKVWAHQAALVQLPALPATGRPVTGLRGADAVHTRGVAIG